MKVFKGKIVSKKMDKTATVAVDRVVVHPLYGKRYKRTKKYYVHDTLGSKVGDEVKFIASKPYSRLKKWKITEIVTKDTQEVGKTRRNKKLLVKKKKGDKSGS